MRTVLPLSRVVQRIEGSRGVTFLTASSFVFCPINTVLFTPPENERFRRGNHAFEFVIEIHGVFDFYLFSRLAFKSENLHLIAVGIIMRFVSFRRVEKNHRARPNVVLLGGIIKRLPCQGRL